MGDLLIVLPALLQLFLQLLLPLGRGRHLTLVFAVVNHVLHPLDLAGIHPLEPVEVVHPQLADGVRRVAVEIDQRLEAVLLAAVEQPVDGALLVDFAVVGEEVLQEIIADDLPAGIASAAQGLGDEFQVLLQRVRAVDFF